MSPSLFNTTSISFSPPSSPTWDEKTSLPEASESISRARRDLVISGSFGTSVRGTRVNSVLRINCTCTCTHLSNLFQVVAKRVRHGRHPELSEPVPQSLLILLSIVGPLWR